jgi:hypothetical protein
MLAGMELLDVSFGVAVLSASNMPFLAVPEWVSEVTIAADNDRPGIEAAWQLKGELIPFEIDAQVEMWGASGSGWDAADELMKRRSA